MMSQSDFLKNAGRWVAPTVATRHYRAAVLSKVHYAELRIMPTSVAKPAWEAVIAVKDAA